MEAIDLLLHAEWVIPVEPANTCLEKTSIAIRGDRIVELLPTAEARKKYAAASEHELDAHVLIPGLINAHTHAAMSLFRGLADDISLHRWLEQHIWPAEQRCVDREFVYDGTLLAAAEMLKSGTTCFNDMYFFPDEAAAASIESGIRCNIGMIIIGFPSAWASSVDEYFHHGQRVHDRYRSHPHVYTAFAPHAPYTVDEDTLARVATLAEELDVQIHMHVHETEDEVSRSVDEHGSRPLARLRDMGLLTHRLVAVHMTQLTNDEIGLIASNGVNVVHCPESNLKLASGFAPVADMAAAGINLALGTDGAASNNDLDMLGEMRTAALLAKGVARDASVVPAHQILEMATLGGATALGLDHDLGSLAAGKLADVVALDLGRLETTPIYDPISQIVYATHRDQVCEVWVGGRQVVSKGELTLIDSESIRQSALRWQQRIRT